MQRADLIKSSDSPYLAPIMVVPNQDGALKLCIDFCRVNLDIVNNAYPMHQIENQLNTMGGAKVFMTPDLTKSYHQLLLHLNCKPVTAFLTPGGIFQWKVLLLGMKTAGAVFQRVMDQILHGMQPRCVAVYKNYITVYSPTLEQHQRDLEYVFRQLEAASLRVSVSKTRLTQDLVLVLGYHVSANGIKPNPKKVTAILQLLEPTSVSEIKCFMGMVNFY